MGIQNENVAVEFYRESLLPPIVLTSIKAEILHYSVGTIPAIAWEVIIHPEAHEEREELRSHDIEFFCYL